MVRKKKVGRNTNWLDENFPCSSRMMSVYALKTKLDKMSDQLTSISAKIDLIVELRPGVDELRSEMRGVAAILDSFARMNVMPLNNRLERNNETVERRLNFSEADREPHIYTSQLTSGHEDVGTSREVSVDWDYDVNDADEPRVRRRRLTEGSPSNSGISPSRSDNLTSPASHAASIPLRRSRIGWTVEENERFIDLNNSGVSAYVIASQLGQTAEQISGKIKTERRKHNIV